MAKHTVVRTDLMAGTDVNAALCSIRFYSSSNPADVDNGVIVELKELDKGEREIMKAEAATAESKLVNCAIVATPEVMYDERLQNLDNFYNEAGKPARAYLLKEGDIFSVTETGFDGAAPSVGGNVGIGAGGKMNSTGSEIGKCIAIEKTGRYTYYTVRVTGSLV